MMVSLLNKTTGEIKLQKIGWSWTCLFFSSVFGLPLFIRRLNVWGGIMILIWAIDFLVADPVSAVFLGIVQLVFSIFFAVSANRMAGKNYLETGWEFAEPNSIETTTARQKWGLSSATYTSNLEIQIRTLAEFRTTKTYDLLTATPLILWYLLGIYGQIPALMAERIAFPLNGENLRALMHVLALVSSFVFVGLIDVLLVIRTPAKTRSHGFTPRAVAFAHAFLGVCYLRIAPAHVSLAVNILSWALSTIGSGAAVIVSLWLGRSFSIMPEARNLVTRGPYAYVRHPLYLAEAIGLVGITLQFAQPWSAILYFVILMLMILRMGYEERVMGEAFPEYRAYAAHTARLIPGVY